MVRANFLWEPDIQTFMLHWIPILFMGVLCVSVIVLMRYMPKTEKHKRRFDLLGFALLALALGGLQMFLDRGEQKDWFESWEIIAEAGLGIADALLQAGLVRMRPIMMTTAAMVFGMLPLALALNEGGEIQAPMGRAIIGGVITSTFLTLLVIPTGYEILDEWRRSFARIAGYRPRQMTAEHPVPAMGD